MFLECFKKNKNIIIGALHFAPLLGYPECPGEERILTDALADTAAFELGGADAIIIENNYDVPHLEQISPDNVELMIRLGHKIAEQTKLPLGVSVLWNDYSSAFTIAKAIGAKFIRVPVFVDDVKTSYGKFLADADKVIAERKRLGAEDIAICADIQVKHAEMITPRSMADSAKAAIAAGADALIITGKWTGDKPDMKELLEARQATGDFPIILGSGVDAANAAELLKVANAAIVSTSLKEGGVDTSEVNLKSWDKRINKQKVAELTRTIKNTPA